MPERFIKKGTEQKSLKAETKNNIDRNAMNEDGRP